MFNIGYNPYPNNNPAQQTYPFSLNNQYMQPFNNNNNAFLPPIPITKEMLNPKKEEINMVSVVRKLKEDRIIEVMNRQMQILEDLKYRVSSQADNEQKKLSDLVEKMEKERESYLKQQRYEELIKERVEKKIKDYLSYGMGYNPYYPSQLPYLIFNVPKTKDEEPQERKKKRKKKKVQIKEEEKVG